MIENIVAQYLSALLEYWKYDVSVFTNTWMYALFFIPVCFYFVFFMFKWFILLLPIIIPLKIIFRSPLFTFKLRDEKKIITHKCGETFHCVLKDKPEIWANGDTVDSALGNLLLNHKKEFNIKVLYEGDET